MGTMETKDQLIKIIKDWVKIDNEIRTLQLEVNKRKAEKKQISVSLMSVMRENEIDCFDINDGQIMYTKKNTKKPITKTSLFNTLMEYCEGNMEKAKEINDYIMENREQNTKESITRKINLLKKGEAKK
jgi:hypothetical protein